MKEGVGGFIVFMSIFSSIGFVILGLGLWNAWQSRRASYWPVTPCQFSELALKEHRGDGDGATTHGVEVRFTYDVGGVEYEGTVLAFGYAPSIGVAAHEEIYRKLKGANLVSARYNPANPAESCLSYGISKSILSNFIFSGIWLALSAGATCLYWLCFWGEDVLLRNLSIG
ncbi:DUF3592 domain-containing protein [Isosphaeraceae bacterium EP7]